MKVLSVQNNERKFVIANTPTPKCMQICDVPQHLCSNVIINLLFVQKLTDLHTNVAAKNVGQLVEDTDALLVSVVPRTESILPDIKESSRQETCHQLLLSADVDALKMLGERACTYLSVLIIQSFKDMKSLTKFDKVQRFTFT